MAANKDDQKRNQRPARVDRYIFRRRRPPRLKRLVPLIGRGISGRKQPSARICPPFGPERPPHKRGQNAKLRQMRRFANQKVQKWRPLFIPAAKRQVR